MKRFSLPIFLLLCLNMLQAQQPEGMSELRMSPRTNVVSYDNENAIEHLRYDDSPYMLSLDKDWSVSQQDGHAVLYQEYEFPRDWRTYRVFFRMKAPSGYGLWLGEQYVGASTDCAATTEFDITSLIRFGKTLSLSVRYVGDNEGVLLDPKGSESVRPSCELLLKPILNVQDYTITTELDGANQMGYYTVEADLYNVRHKGKCYLEVEVWDPKGHQVDKLGKWCFFDKRSETTQSISSSVPKVQAWNAEVPRLYTAVIRLYNEKMELLDVVGSRFGFRTVSCQGLLTINGKAVTLKGITLPVSPSDLGTPESVKQVRSQMVQMKCHNINAIRVVGGNPPRRFFELCDELGFYVVCDANLFPASTMGHVVAADNEYADFFSDRMRSLYGQFKNHTSIIAWTLGTSPDNGGCMQTAYHTLKQLDSSRPIIYSGAQYSDNTDLIAPFDCNTDFLNQYLAKKATRPLIMLSYGSTVGNNMGGLEPIWQKVNDNQSIQGGFLNLTSWQSFNDMPYHSELRQLYRPFDVRLTSISVDAAEFDITNLCDFRLLADYRLEYVICSNLKPNIVSGEETFSLKPGETKPIKLKIPKLMLYAGEELYIRFSIRQRGTTSTVPKNYELCTQQFSLPSSNVPNYQYVDNEGTPLTIEKDVDHQVHIRNNNISVEFNDTLGLITSMKYRGVEMICEAPTLNFWRDISYNDRLDPNGYKQWMRYKNQMECEVVATNCRKVEGGSVGLDVMLRYTSPQYGVLFDVRQAYLILKSGDVLINNDITVAEQIKSMARVGMSMGVPSTFQSVEWLGHNLESYSDRKSAGNIAQQMQPIVNLIQEKYDDGQHEGNRVETRWLALLGEQYGLYVDILDTLSNFSISQGSNARLSSSDEVSDAESPIGSSYQLDVDYSMAGVGGAVAGINLQDKDLVKDHKYSFTLHVRPFDRDEYNAQDFRRINYPQVVSNIVELPVIHKGRDRFDGPMQITLSCKTPKSEIHYTLDGTVPTEKSPLYTKPFTIQNSVVVTARAFKKGEAPSFVATEQFSFDYVVSCHYAHSPNTPYNKNMSRALFDGEIGDVNDLSRGWLGFSGHDVQVDLELGKPISMNGVTLRFAHVPDAWVFAPREVFVLTSSDGKEYSDPIPATISYDAADEAMNTTQLQVVNIEVNHSNVRFVRVIAKPIKGIPQWHRAKGLNPWIMLDEIKIEETVAK